MASPPLPSQTPAPAAPQRGMTTERGLRVMHRTAEGWARREIACPHGPFLEVRAKWLSRHWHLEASRALSLAQEEQRLRLFHTQRGPMACEYTDDALRALYAAARLDGDTALTELLQPYWEKERAPVRTPSFFEPGYVFAPYVPQQYVAPVGNPRAGQSR